MIRTRAAVIAAGALLLACQPSVPLPPVSASAHQVLDAYLSALRAGDCATAHALATSTFRFGSGELCGHLHVSAGRISPGEPAQPNADEVVFATTLTVSGGDESIPDGEQTWFYTLERQVDGAWRLTGGGGGP